MMPGVRWLLLVILVVSRIPAAHGENPHGTPPVTTWTFTYLKALPGQRSALKQFVEANWFAMDRLAVARGLFVDYQLIENAADTGSAEDAEWDYIVAVEYFADQSYADISTEFEQIRAAHSTLLIDGKSFPELGRVLRSERARINRYQ